MLLQSHEGYIEPLAAIPSEWNTGFYAGLVARGNFEVSASWKNGAAESFSVLSHKGGTVSVRYKNISSCDVVRTLDGKSIEYSIVNKDEISFETNKEERYDIELNY